MRTCLCLPVLWCVYINHRCASAYLDGGGTRRPIGRLNTRAMLSTAISWGHHHQRLAKQAAFAERSPRVGDRDKCLSRSAHRSCFFSRCSAICYVYATQCSTQGCRSAGRLRPQKGARNSGAVRVRISGSRSTTPRDLMCCRLARSRLRFCLRHSVVPFAPTFTQHRV